MKLRASKKGRSISDNLSKNTVSHRAARGSRLAGLFLRGGSQLHRETGEARAEIVAGMFARGEAAARGAVFLKHAARLPWVVRVRIKSERGDGEAAWRRRGRTTAWRRRGRGATARPRRRVATARSRAGRPLQES